MGNPIMDGAPNTIRCDAISTYYSPETWIEGAAEDQLNQVATLAGVRKIAAFPDLHPGKFGPVGCAILSDQLYPQLIGNDIGCGMSLFSLDLHARKIKIDKVTKKMRSLECAMEFDGAALLESAGLPTSLHPGVLGTIGGGNHFCELQIAGEVFNKAVLSAHNIDPAFAFLLVHSGSRSLGASIFDKAQTSFKPEVTPCEEIRDEYLEAHDQAVRWASLNRMVVAERAAKVLGSEVRMIADSPHNLIERTGSAFLHRKGAAKADIPLVPLAGSRDAISYLLAPDLGMVDALASLSHGCGRKFDRRSMQGRVGNSKSDRDQLARTSFGGAVICDDRRLLIEEAPLAYKKPEQVLADLMAANLARPILSLKPLVTFKKAAEVQRIQRKPKRHKRHRKGEQSI